MRYRFVERAEMEKALKKPGDLTAWEAVMRARASGARMTGDGLSNSVVEARKAVAIAPDYAQGHNWYLYGGRDASMAREARAHAERAVALDASDPVWCKGERRISWRAGMSRLCRP